MAQKPYHGDGPDDWLHEVWAGGAIGVGGTWLGYWLGVKITGKKSRYQVGFDGNCVSLAVKL